MQSHDGPDNTGDGTLQGMSEASAADQEKAAQRGRNTSGGMQPEKAETGAATTTQEFDEVLRKSLQEPPEEVPAVI